MYYKLKYQENLFMVKTSFLVGQLWRHLCLFNDQCNINGKLTGDLYPFLYQTLSKNDNFTLNKGSIHLISLGL